jgi:tRNA threonylcarbamoyl adenosine modification protein YeaZ
VLILAFDTATNAATSALVRDGEVLGERVSRAVQVLADADELLRAAGLAPRDLDALVVGTGPGSFTGVRIGVATARGLAVSLGVPLAGVSTLDALAAGAAEPGGGGGALPVIDARRREVFVPTRAVRPEELEVEGRLCVGDGAVRYRELLEARGAAIPADGDPRHLPHARYHAALARDFGEPGAVEPIYLRIPDAERAA